MYNGNGSSKKKKRRTIHKRNTEKNRSVYIVLSKTATLPSNVIKMWTKKPYAHTSLALDLELREMYSFARKGIYNPFNCGFISEDIESGIFGRHKDTTCKVLRLPVTTKQYRKIRRILDDFKKNRSFYRYNYIGIFGVLMNRAIDRRYNYFCSQFVYFVLQQAGIKMFGSKPGLAKPDDFRMWDAVETVYEGRLHDYRQYLQDHSIYETMEKKRKRKGRRLYKKNANIISFDQYKMQKASVV